MRPDPDPEARLCLKLSIDGLTAYGNRQAISALRDQMNWILTSNPSDNFECHVALTLENDQSKFFGHLPTNVWTILSKDVLNIGGENALQVAKSFELTIMQVEEYQLDELEVFQDTRVI